MLTARMFSSFLKFNSIDRPSFRGKDRYFNGLESFGAKSNFDPKWGEIGLDIVKILVFFALEEAHDPISQRSGQNFP